tara:strand:+ start:821 stop:1876 length:1056 start_codon:yes stop_codon:yes gene_type:complete
MDKLDYTSMQSLKKEMGRYAKQFNIPKELLKEFSIVGLENNYNGSGTKIRKGRYSSYVSNNLIENYTKYLSGIGQPVTKEYSAVILENYIKFKNLLETYKSKIFVGYDIDFLKSRGDIIPSRHLHKLIDTGYHQTDGVYMQTLNYPYEPLKVVTNNVKEYAKQVFNSAFSRIYEYKFEFGKANEVGVITQKSQHHHSYSNAHDIIIGKSWTKSILSKGLAIINGTKGKMFTLSAKKIEPTATKDLNCTVYKVVASGFKNDISKCEHGFLIVDGNEEKRNFLSHNGSFVSMCTGYQLQNVINDMQRKFKIWIYDYENSQVVRTHAFDQHLNKAVSLFNRRTKSQIVSNLGVI